MTFRQPMIRLVALAVVLVATASYSQTTVTTSVDIFPDDDLGQAVLCAAGSGASLTRTFLDPVGGSWESVTVRFEAAAFQAGGPAPTVTVAINGQTIGSTVITNLQFGLCGNHIPYEITTTSLPGYIKGGYNTLTFTHTDNFAYGGGSRNAELIFRLPPPRTFAFDLVPTMSQNIILHPVPGDTNLSTWQVPTNPNDKPRFRFRGAVSSNTGASLEADVWLRVVDPPDPSLYVPQAQRVPDDNQDPLKKGVLMPRGCAIPSCRALPGQPFQVRSSAGGVVEVELEATDRYAGDNYYLEASFDPTFTCATAGPNGTNICARSGQVTAWKRVFIEKRRMLRNGLFLAWNAQAGDTHIITRGNHWNGNQGTHDELSKNEKIVIVHAPQLDRSDLNAGWYFEMHNILSVQDLGNGQFRVNLGRKQGNTIIPEALQHDYSVDNRNPSIGDAIAKLGSLAVTAADVFLDVPMNLVTGEAFRDSFTENIILPDNTTPGAGVPVPFLETDDEDLLQDLAEKWSSVVNGTLAPNHQLLILASDNEAGAGSGNASGLTISQVAGRTSSYVFLNAIDQQLNGNANNPDIITWARKTAAHEIAHQWETNGSFSVDDHCPPATKVWNDASLSVSAYCLLAAFDPNGAGSVTQRLNGIARFHFLALPGGGTHSEYLEIRKRPDPFVP